MPKRAHILLSLVVLAALGLCALLPGVGQPTRAASPPATGPAVQPITELSQLDGGFKVSVRPLLQTYCIGCHGEDKPEAGLNLNSYSSVQAVVNDGRRWNLVLDRLKSQKMPPVDAPAHPSAAERDQAVQWFSALRDFETVQNANDPGIVLARRLSNEEFNYTVRDLTGVDLQPTKEFPADPDNTAGFDNSGESLVMSPELLNKYLAAARDVANHMFLLPKGFSFSPYTMLAETDRDRHCVSQIIDFYATQDTDYADYFQAAWHYKYRAALGKPNATIAEIAGEAKVSAKYLGTIWTTLEATPADVGPLVKLQALWKALPAPDMGGARANAPAGEAINLASIARPGCEAMRDYVVGVRKKVEVRFLNITAGKIGAAAEPLLIWKNVQYATHRMNFDPQQLQVEGEPAPVVSTAPEVGSTSPFGPGKTQIIKNVRGDPDLVVPAGQRAKYEAAFGQFCAVFPDKFFMEERGRNYFDTTKDRGRYLSAGYHSLLGYFRDDQPLYQLMLDDQQQKQLDEMWLEMDFVAAATERMYIEFYANGKDQGDGQGDNRRHSTTQPGPITSQASIRDLEGQYLNLASTGDERGKQAIRDYFEWINSTLRSVEKAKLAAEPTHLAQLLDFAAKAYRRPLTQAEKDDLLAFYHDCRDKEGMDHESAMRQCIVDVLMAPDTMYRIDLIDNGKGVHPLSDYELASRLSYFLWASIPDDELLAHAAAGDLHKPEVIAAEARRMLKDPRVRGLATEFGGNWLDFRNFEQLNTVDRERFSTFTPALRAAMFEEPVRFMMDVFQTNRPILDLIYGNDTFVNPALATHYGMPVPKDGPDGWVRVDDADKYGRGGLLPMAVFLTKNAPGLRTSPVKRGNWVVKNVLGERIPPPPPVVPELPHDEAKSDLPLRDMLARHRADPNCAACHAKFDSLGLVFEGFGPIGEQRKVDLAGRPIDASATFPGGMDGTGVEGLKSYIRAQRQDDFVDNMCSKLLAYALGRSIMLSDDPLVNEMHSKLAADGYHFDDMIETIVTSRQFLNKRGNDDAAGN